jgi:pilus assembly protein FimV
MAAAMAAANRDDAEEDLSEEAFTPGEDSIEAFFASADPAWSEEPPEALNDTIDGSQDDSVAARLARIREAARAEADLGEADFGGLIASRDDEEAEMAAYGAAADDDEAFEPAFAEDRDEDEDDYDARDTLDARLPEDEEEALRADLEAIEQDFAAARAQDEADAPAAEAEADPAEEAQDAEARAEDADDAALHAELASLTRAEDEAPEPEPEAPAAQDRADDADAVDRDEGYDDAVYADADDADADDEDDEDDASGGKAAQLGSSTGPGHSGDMDRLFDATDSRLANVETSRRRANIQHLKAAVAARVAERRLVEAGVREGDDSVDATAEYRADLARVMRPTRVRVDVSRRRDSRPAPLVLVSEQRIDRDDTLASAGPVRPRRVGSTDEEDAVADEAQYEERMVATGETQFGMSPASYVPAPPPKKITRSLAILARRAGLIMRGSEAEADADAEAAPVEPPFPRDADRPETAARPAATATPRSDAELDEDDEAGNGAQDSDLPEYVMRFATMLEESDATEIDEVVEMGAIYITRDLGQTEFKRVQLIRLVRMATDESIGRDDAMAAIATLSARGILSQSANGRYRLNRRSER